MELIHYGAKTFIPGRINPIKNSWAKPTGGLWTSPVDSNFGWKDWCKMENFRDCDEENSFRIQLKDDAKILVIDSIKDLSKLIWTTVHDIIAIPDFEECAKHYDAIHLTEHGQTVTRMSDPLSFYGWDCESVLIMNPKAIKY